MIHLPPHPSITHPSAGVTLNPSLHILPRVLITNKPPYLYKRHIPPKRDDILPPKYTPYNTSLNSTPSPSPSHKAPIPYNKPNHSNPLPPPPGSNPSIPSPNHPTPSHPVHYPLKTKTRIVKPPSKIIPPLNSIKQSFTTAPHELQLKTENPTIFHENPPPNTPHQSNQPSINSDPLNCILCSFTSKSFHGLQLHLFHHSQKPTLKCSSCDFKTMNFKTLNTHVKLHLPAPSPYLCKQCNFTCQLKRTFLLHLNSHSPILPLYCNSCQFFTYEPTSLRNHVISTSHTSSLTHPLHCGHCTFTSKSPPELRRHQRLHAETYTYKCPLCSLTFKGKNKYNFNRHLLIHSRSEFLDLQ